MGDKIRGFSDAIFSDQLQVLCGTSVSQTRTEVLSQEPLEWPGFASGLSELSRCCSTQVFVSASSGSTSSCILCSASVLSCLQQLWHCTKECVVHIVTLWHAWSAVCGFHESFTGCSTFVHHTIVYIVPLPDYISDFILYHKHSQCQWHSLPGTFC